MKKNINYWMAVISLFTTVCLLTACNNRIDMPQKDNNMRERFENSIKIAKNHSNMVDHIMNSIAQTRADGGNCEEVIYTMFCDYIKGNGLENIFDSEESINNVLHPLDVEDSINETIGNDFIADVETIIDNVTDKDMLKESLLELLIDNNNSQNIEDMLTMSGIAVDSYEYWNTQASTRGILSAATRIVKADVLSAGAYICKCGLVALFSGATPPGAGAIALAAGFGSAVQAVTLAFE